jgi:hypothetical protein
VLVDIKILGVRNPRWENATSIYCEVIAAHWNGWLPFSASLNDPEPHGRQLYEDLVSGVHGPIATALAVETPERLEDDAGGGLAKFWPDADEFLREANAENARGTSRGMCLVWTAMVEIALREKLPAYLAERGKKFSDFRKPDGKKYGTGFYDVIEVAEACELINADTARHLHILRDVRNVCAHQWRLDFSNPEVAKLLPKFEVLRDELFPSLIISHDFEFLIRMLVTSTSAKIVGELLYSS